LGVNIVERSPWSRAASICQGKRRARQASNRKAHPAAAGRDGVGVLDLERLTHQVVDEVELRALHQFERDRVDHHCRSVADRDEVVVGARAVDVVGVLEARAAAALDGNAQRRALFALEDGVQPFGGAGAGYCG